MKKITLLLAVILIAFTNLSAQTVLDSPVPGVATRVTLASFIANWTPVANAVSYDVKIYSSTLAQVGSTLNITGASSSKKTIEVALMLTPATAYTFTVTAKGDGMTYSDSPESVQSSSFTTETSGSFVLQYAPDDVMQLNADLGVGAADIYELITSAGLYKMDVGSTSDNNKLIRNTTIRAAAGLAAKPYFNLKTTASGSTSSFFNIQPANITLKLSGIDFDGTQDVTTKPMLVYAKGTGALNFSVYISDCIIRNFQNAGGNGIVRLDGFSASQPSGLIDMQNCIVYNFGGRALYLNQPSSTTVAGTINLKNCTFSTNTSISSRANVIYNAASSTYYTGSMSIDHCTFDNLTGGTEAIIKQNSFGTGASISITNSIFTAVTTAALNSGISLDNCYVAGLSTSPSVTPTNSLTILPTYVDATNFNLNLTNASSLICTDFSVAGNKYIAAPIGNAGSDESSDGFTANWTVVTNAINYVVKVYQGATLISANNASGQATSSLAITGLSQNTEYTYTVTAQGDNSDFYNSSASNVIIISTTSTTELVNTKTSNFITVSGKKINSSEVGTIEVYNLQGAQVLRVENVKTLNTKLNNGMYIVRFTNSLGIQLNQKVMIN